MSKNIRKFTSQAAYDAYKAEDGWDYPSVSFVETSIDSQVHYNNEFIMRWNTADTSKTPSFYGEISHDEFKDWVEHAAWACEIPRNSTSAEDVAFYPTVGTTNTVSSWTDSNFHQNDTAYLQMAAIENINVGCFQDTSRGIKEIRFNFDKGCPDGFHKWFKYGTTAFTATDGVIDIANHKYFKNTSKLFGRFDVAPITSTTQASTGAEGIDVRAGSSQGTKGNMSDYTLEGGYSKGNWNSNALLAGIKATNANLLELTYWEYYVMSMIFCAYYKTFDVQSKHVGMISGYDHGQAGDFTNGTTEDTLFTAQGEVSTGYSTNTAYRFMHLENPLHGKQWIWGAGWKGNNGTYYMTFDDKKANLAATMNNSNSDVSGTYLTNMSSSYISDIDVYGVPTEVAGSSTTGFYDAAWSSTGSDRVAYLGGLSYLGDGCGGFARRFDLAASDPFWARRGRVTMNL
jgi:hypothetical protein